jgi:hypothetical protein
MKVGALDSHQRPTAPRRFVRRVVEKSRCLDKSRSNVGPGRKIDLLVEPRARNARLVPLERGKSVGVLRKLVDAEELTPAMIAPVRPWRQAPILMGVARYKFAK